MHPLKMLLCCFAGMALCAGASAQIYETKDAKGNSAFSDKPSHGAEQVQLSPTNSADPVAERPRPAPDSTGGAAPQQSAQPADDNSQEHGYQHDHDDSYYYGGTYNNDSDDADSRRDQRNDAADRPNNDLPGRDGTGRDRPNSDKPYVDHRDTSSSTASGMNRSSGSRPAAGARGR